MLQKRRFGKKRESFSIPAHTHRASPVKIITSPLGAFRNGLGVQFPTGISEFASPLKKLETRFRWEVTESAAHLAKSINSGTRMLAVLTRVYVRLLALVAKLAVALQIANTAVCRKLSKFARRTGETLAKNSLAGVQLSTHRWSLDSLPATKLCWEALSSPLAHSASGGKAEAHGHSVHLEAGDTRVVLFAPGPKGALSSQELDASRARKIGILTTFSKLAAIEDSKARM